MKPRPIVSIADPDSPLVQAALQWTCDVCKAPKHKLCTPTIGDTLPGRVIHFARLVDRRREAKGDE